jgi:hypothetical protein
MSLEGHVNASGYPLQIAIENAIVAQTNSHGFSVLYREHAWRSESGKSEGFADLVLAYEGEVIHFVVECKRVLDSDWTFLIEREAQLQRRHAKAFVFREDGEKRRFEWLDLTLDPRSPESAFCAIPGASGGGRPIIERSAAELVEATEAIATEAREFALRDRSNLQIYFPLLVTTARLQACTYRPEDISLATGKVANAKFNEVPFVRFRKQLSPTQIIPPVYATFGRKELAKAKEHTIFVVNSERIGEFLSAFSLDSDGTNRRYLLG